MDPEYDKQLIEECYARSVDLLKYNSTPQGILAASITDAAKKKRYTNIFGRDAAIAVLGLSASDDPELVQTARESLFTLARHQAENGSIPKYVEPFQNENDFWYLGCIDATLWWLIAISTFDRHTQREKLSPGLHTEIRRAIAWLQAHEHPKLHLLSQNEASDWADVMPRSGFVLYTNALWYKVKCLYDLPGKHETKKNFNHIFSPFSNETVDHRRLRILRHYIRNSTTPTPLYMSFVNFSFWGDEGDVLGNALAVWAGLASDHQAREILHEFTKHNVESAYSARTVCTPIAPEHSLWRPYMERHRQNLPYQYHNGGIWPFIGGFLSLAHATKGNMDAAHTTLAKMARANKKNGWEFNEWFHGETLEPLGMKGQTWNASMFIAAYHTLHPQKKNEPAPAESTPFHFPKTLHSEN